MSSEPDPNQAREQRSSEAPSAPPEDRDLWARLARLRDDAVICTIFLTRLPLRFDGDITPDRQVQAMRCFPVPGILVALIGGAIYAAAEAVWHLGALASAVLAAAAMLAATGAFHEDGLADTADGLGGGQTLADKLTIMRDSRLGTYGAAALFLALALLIALIARIGEPLAVLGALVTAGAASRAGQVALMHLVPPARDEGQSAAAGRPSAETAVQAGVIAAIAAVLSTGVWGLLLSALGAAAGCWAVGALAQRHIGGQTGDVLGAAQVVSQAAILMLLVAFLHR